MRLPPRLPSSAVMTMVEPQSSIRPPRLSGEKPPNTTECTAPMRAQASIATAASGIMGMYRVMRSPFFAPRSLSTLAMRHTSACSSA